VLARVPYSRLSPVAVYAPVKHGENPVSDKRNVKFDFEGKRLCDMSDPLTEYIRIYAPHLASDVTEDTLLLEQGLLDSLGLMKLVAFLERQYRLVVPEEEITSDNFASLATIRKLIDRLSAEK
jgi:acyl carrier protein